MRNKKYLPLIGLLLVGLIFVFNRFCPNSNKSEKFKFPIPIFTSNNQWVFVISNSEVVKTNYKNIMYDGNIFICKDLNNKFGLINTKLEETSIFAYDTIYSLNKLIYIGTINNKRFILSNDSLNQKYPLKDSVCGYWRNGLIIICRNAKFGIINNKGEELIEPKLDKVLYDFYFTGYHYIYEKAIYMKADKEGYIDELGKIISDKTFDLALPVHFGQAPVMSDNKWGLIDINCNFILEPKYKSIGEIGSYNAPLKKDKGFVHDRNYFKFNDLATELRHSHSDLRRIMYNSKASYIDSNGKVIYDSKYDFCYDFYEGFALTKQGFINKNNQLQIKAKFQKATHFSNGVSIVTINGKKELMDTSGSIISNKFDVLYNAAEGLPFSSSIFICGNNIKKFKQAYGLIDQTGKQILPMFYCNVQLLDSNLLLLEQNASKSIFNIHYNFLINIGGLDSRVIEADSNFLIIGYLQDGKKMYKIFNIRTGKLILDSISKKPIIYGEDANIIMNGKNRIINRYEKLLWQEK